MAFILNSTYTKKKNACLTLIYDWFMQNEDSSYSTAFFKLTATQYSKNKIIKFWRDSYK